MARWGTRCFAYGPNCEGRVVAAHYVSAQRLREERRKLALTPYRFTPEDPRHGLVRASLDELLADSRNGIPLCHHHHAAFDGKRASKLTIPAPQCVIDFATQYGLTHLIHIEVATDNRREVHA